MEKEEKKKGHHTWHDCGSDTDTLSVKSSRLNLQHFRSQGPILQLQNLQLQRQRCSRLERFFKVEENNCFQNAPGYPWRCKILQRWRCNSRS
jgi:hypothetical protein